MIVFLGLSHLSVCYAASLIKLNKLVTIIDNESEINNYKLGITKIYEPGLEEILKKKSFKLTSNYSYLKKCKIIFLAKDIKTDSKNNIILNECLLLLKKSYNFSNNKTLVIMNQVPVGFTRKVKWKSKKIYHFVETLVFGNAIFRALKPERIIIGKTNKNTKLSQVLKEILVLYRCPIIELTYEESELTKGFINTFLAAQLSTTNFLAEICNKYQARWSEIFSAISLDKRIGKDGYYKPGLGISGGNIERDLRTLNKLSIKYKLKKDLALFLLKSSDYYKNQINLLIKKKKMRKIAILGLTYKEDTLSIKNAPQIDIIKKTKKILLHDYKSDYLKKNIIKVFKFKFYNLKYCLKNSETIIIFHNLKIYKDINFSKYSNIKNIIDPFGFLKLKKNGNKNYYTISK